MLTSQFRFISTSTFLDYGSYQNQGKEDKRAVNSSLPNKKEHRGHEARSWSLPLRHRSSTPPLSKQGLLPFRMISATSWMPSWVRCRPCAFPHTERTGLGRGTAPTYPPCWIVSCFSGWHPRLTLELSLDMDTPPSHGHPCTLASSLLLMVWIACYPVVAHQLLVVTTLCLGDSPLPPFPCQW